MNTQTTGFKSNNQKIRQEILREINSIWKIVEALEKKSKDALGETNPTTEALGFVAVHMMNASFEIDGHISECTNKLSPKSVSQLLEILSIIRCAGPKCRSDIREAYQTALKNVRSKYKRRRNTMADLCVRRLGFSGQGGTDQFLSLVEDWLFSKGTGLSELIKEHTYDHQYQKIDEFFKSGGIIQ